MTQKNLDNIYDLIVIGAGASGMMASIKSKRDNKSVLLIEQLEKLGKKLLASGGGRCNLTNTLSKEDFIKSFGKDGRFLKDAIDIMDNKKLISFFDEIGLETSIKDGFRVFPSSHKSQSVLDAFQNELHRLNIEISYNTKINQAIKEENIFILKSNNNQEFYSKNILISTGGCGFGSLGGNMSGYEIAKSFGHKIQNLYPAMLPLKTKENWINNCKADTISKATISVNIKKYKKLKANGDLIFGNNILRGPVILDFARFITPLFDKYDEIPITLNLLKGFTEDNLINYIKTNSNKNSKIIDILSPILAKSVIKEICKLCDISENEIYNTLKGEKKNIMIKNFCSTPLTIIGSSGFENAMVTNGGVTLKEINSKTMQSKLVDGLYFAGEILNIDGPCGGYNLQWAFSSGNLAGMLKT
jgi:predicted Rossmann fold flavoprotein